MAPIVHGLEAEYEGKIKFAYLDIDDQRTGDTKRSLGFTYQPEFYLLNGQGQVIKKWIGRVSADDFRAEFNRNLTE
jgi:hypothetical protein